MIQAFYFFLSLSLLIILHELGHFLTAKMFKTRVEKFYLFFDFLFPFPTLLNFTLFKKKIGDTEYGLGWFPFGGYVKIAGMVDESDDEEQLNKEPQPGDYRLLKPWQRLIILSGGVIVNAILGWLIYSMLLFTQGEGAILMKDAKYGFVADSLAQSVGFKTGDKIIGYDKEHKFEDATVPVVKDLLLDDAKTVQVERNGQMMDISIPEGTYKAIIEARGKLPFLRLAFPAEIDSAGADSPILKEYKKGDVMIELAGQPVNYFAEIGIILQQNVGKKIDGKLLRGTDTVNISFIVPEDAKLQIFAPNVEKFLPVQKTEYGFVASFGAGFTKSIETLRDYAKQFKLIFNPKYRAYKQIGGFASMASMFPKGWDWVAFWGITAFISLVLAFMNILPIPMLDGGYLIFTLVEMLTGYKFSDKFIMRANMVGLVIILGLMILANGNDLIRWISGKW